MSGLIEKDLRLTLTRKQTLLIFLIMAFFMGASIDGAFIVSYLTMLGTIIAIGTITYDEYDNGYAFLMTLPFDRKTYVKEKYLFSLLMATASWIFGMIVYVIFSIIRHDPMFMDNTLELLVMLTGMIPVVYLCSTFMIPLQLKYGSERSRTVLFIIYGIIAVIAIGARSLLNGVDNPFAGLDLALNSIPPYVILITLFVICAILTYVSYLISVRIMEKKEF
ncbi:MAG: ABC-2 transporter permease [Erysipelotrichaceae bacterium]|nr:ABC-2 transporter permease [Erysipelotrichaceae bacterium]